MNDIEKPGDLRTMHDVVRYVDAYLKRRGELSDEDVAGGIVALASNDNFEEWYRTDSDFAAMHDLASDLEWSNTRWPDLDWADIQTHITRLEQRYSPGSVPDHGAQ